MANEGYANDGPTLELRVHGVNNTPPHSMLDLPADDVEEVVGDSAAGFWRPKSGSLAHVDTRERGWVPNGVTRESYSWGNLARTTVGIGSGAVGKIVAALTRIGWFALLPFGLANVAYWTRVVDKTRRVDLPPGGGPPSEEAAKARRGPGSWHVRLFGIGLTIFLVVTLCELAMDLVATQCYAPMPGATDPSEGLRVCGKLPGFFDVLTDRTPALRLAIGAAVPVVALLGLWWLSSTTRGRYEKRLPLEPPKTKTGHSLADPRYPLIAGHRFWRGDTLVAELEKLHLTAGFALVSLALAWPALFGAFNPETTDEPNGACGTAGSLVDVGGPTLIRLTDACNAQVGLQPSRQVAAFGICAGLAVLLLLWVVLTSWWRSAADADANLAIAEKRRDSPIRWFLHPTVGLIVAVLLLLATVACLLGFDPPIAGKVLLGVNTFPTFGATFLFALAATAILMRLIPFSTGYGLVLFVGLIAGAASKWFAIGAAAGFAVLILVVYLTSRGGIKGPRRWTAWKGAGPGVFLSFSFLAQMTISSLVVVGAGDWLNGSHSASNLIAPPPGTNPIELKTTDCGALCPLPAPELRIGRPYGYLGTAAIIAVAILILLVIAMTLITRLRGPGGGSPAPHDKPAPDHGDRGDTAGTTDASDDPVGDDNNDQQFVNAVAGAERGAYLAHRAEPALMYLVVIGMLCSTAAILVCTSVGANDSLPNWLHWLRPIANFSTAGLAIIAAAVLGALIAGATSSKVRPFGIVWDLVCFLPRAAHPFGPPCYAERAVPELTSRLDWWLADDERPELVGGQRRRGERVVVSAHSLGCVLTVAALLWRDPSTPREHDIRLITYGCQLRAFFSRIFPELLGPRVLGIPAARTAQFWSADPWAKELAPDPAIPTRPGLTDVDGIITLRSLLTADERELWQNLWRRTDFIGFPVYSYRADPAFRGGDENDDNPLDRRADAVDKTMYLGEIQNHSNYFRSPEYADTLQDLMGDQ